MKNNSNKEHLPYSGKVTFTDVDIKTSFKNRTAIKEWLSKAIKKEGYKLGELGYNFCSDNYLLNINIEHLNHDFYTDIITFELNEGNVVIGDIYISNDRVKENAQTNNNTYHKEMLRVLIHGVLHLCGYKDKTKKEATLMREKEDYYISLLQ
ncbi:MAG: rRNA maturation RNase YbeY [Bacteroidia bacterium]|nr:rRNA maturation RNase YbeY [Bacteroidia bacterium]MBP9689102.1 rRNA maturation RNase YbeY [Bacteroidia bacterium]